MGEAAGITPEIGCTVPIQENGGPHKLLKILRKFELGMKYGTVVNNAKDDTKAVFLGYAKINYGPEPDVFIPATEAERKQFEEEQS